MNKDLLKVRKVSHSTELGVGCDNIEDKERIDNAILTAIYEVIWADYWFDGCTEDEANKKILDLYNKEGKDILEFIENKIKKYAEKN